MAIASNFPAIHPSLNLDFANARALDPRITFSRASAATYYDGKTTAKAEENLLPYSQDLNNAWWAKARGTVTSNAAVAPDGTTTAELLTASVTGLYACVYRGGWSYAGSLPYTLSVYAKANTSQFLRLLINETVAFGSAWFDLGNGISGAVGTGATSTIQSVGNGWYRCTVTATPTTTSSALVVIGVVDADNNNNVTAGASLFIWGAQLEQRGQVTAYTPTTTQPITNYIPVLQTAPAGVPRFDHNPVTGESLGLLVEEQRTNLLIWSEQLNNAGWVKSEVAIVPDCIVAPDGTLSGDKVISSTVNTIHQVTASVAKAASSVTLTRTVYAKAGEEAVFALTDSDLVNTANIASCLFTLSGSGSASAPSVGGTFSSAIGSIQSLPNGWFKCSLTYTTGAETAVLTRIRLGVGGAAYSGNGYNGLYIWGSQLEAGAFPTSYIKTEASQVTRATDSASMTGANFSSWYRQDEGTFAQEFSPLGVSVADRASFGVYESSGGFYANSITVRNYNGSHKASAHVNSVSQAEIGISPNVVGGSAYKIAYSYQSNYLAFARDGVNPTFDTSASIPVVNALLFPGSGCQHIKRFAFYPKALPEFVQALTA